MSLADRALATATDAHHGQTRRHGAAYIDHPVAVALLAEDLAGVLGLPFGDRERAIALLHDVVEDSPAHPIGVVEERFGQEVAHEVALLTKTGKGEAATTAYYDALRRHGRPTTRLIKIADRLHNLSELHKVEVKTPEALQAAVGKTAEYTAETERFVRQLIGDDDDVALALPGCLHGVLDEAIDNARRNAIVLKRRAGRDDPAPTPPARGLYAIVQPSPSLPARLEGVLAAGVAVVQLRVKHAPSLPGLSDRAWIALAERCAEVCADYGVPLIINDRPDIARAVQLAGHALVGVHVGDTDVPAAVARDILGDDVHIGTSTHSVEQLLAVDQHQGASHLALGPIWSSPTKSGHAAVVGDDHLRDACIRSRHPVIAIGGIVDPERAARASAAGATLVAAVSAFADPDPALGVDDVGGYVHLLARRFAIAARAAVPTLVRPSATT